MPSDSTKRLLMHLSACCKWARRSKLVGDNPFEEMAAEIKLKKVSNEEIEIKPFTRVGEPAIADKSVSKADNPSPVGKSEVEPEVKQLGFF